MSFERKKEVKNTCLIVLGMHRSGTSCLAGTLEAAGLFLGDVSVKNPHNLKGNRENPRIMKLHNDLLEYNNGAWDNPPDSVFWPSHLKIERDTIIKGYINEPVWGFKDPRTLLVLDGWLEVLSNVFPIATFRHPGAVVESLRKRNGKLSVEKCLHLYEIYNKKLLHYHKGYHFPVLSFDLDETEYKSKLVDLLKREDINLNPGGLEFYDDSLRHNRARSDFIIPENIMHLYHQLQEAAL